MADSLSSTPDADFLMIGVKRLVKLGIACLWYLGTGASRFLLGRPRRRLTILYYHAVPAGHRKTFAAQMDRLRRSTHLVFADHSQPLSNKRPTTAVTFDDAFRSVGEVGLPILVAKEIPATIFVPTGYLGKPPGWAMETMQDRQEVVMSAEELSALPVDLIRIGSHTVDHPKLSTLDEVAIDAQLVQSKAELEALVGQAVDTLAFPYGDHDDHVVERCRRAGYRQIYSVSPEAVNPESGQIKRGRTAVNPWDGPLEFHLKMHGAYNWMPIASRIKRKLQR